MPDIRIKKTVCMLEIKNASVAFDGRTLFEGISFAAPDCSTFCIAGRRGCGKTVLLRAALGLTALREGHISIDGELLSPASAQEFRRQIISYMPQNIAFGDFTVGGIAAELLGLKSNRGRVMPRSLMTEEWNRVGLTDDVYGRSLRDLTVSEARRALLVLVTMQNKPVVLIDGLTDGLGEPECELVARYLNDRARGGQTVIVTTADEAFAKLTDRSITLS